MSGRWNDAGGGGDSSQDFTQATQEESVLELDEYTQVEPVADGGAEDSNDSALAAEPVPWGRLMRLSGGSAVSLMPRPEQTRGRALNEVTLGRGKVCEVQVSDGRVSSKHCRIYCEVVSGHLGGMEVYVEDMSANGTWINQDMKLVRGQRRLLHSGDEISLLNPYKHLKRTAAGGSSDKEAERGAGAESGKEANDAEKLEAEAATFTFINLNRNRGASHGRAGSLSVAETLRARTAPGVSSPVLRSSASGVAGIFGGARKVEDLYDVREMIGHGTSGEVRRAINRTTGKQVAVKVIETRKFALTPGLTPKELVQEAEMLKRVDHEYIIKLEDIFQTEQAVYLVMDLVSGGDLFDRIVEKGVYAEDLAQELLFRVLTAVNYLHSQDIVHRDLKPENILLVGRDNDVDVKITDFGLAKRANKEGLKTFCGTPQYFAPEVLKRRNTVLGVGRYGKEADMWSVGVILYILLSGTHPFHTTTLFDQITHASYSMSGAEWEHISAAAKDLVSKLLTESPKARLTADQALGHPFITDRAAARASLAAAAAAAGVAAKPLEEGGSAAREDPGKATAKASKASAEIPGKRDRSAANGEEGKPEAQREVATGGRTSSHETEPASNSGAEESSVKSLSPTEGGGGSAKAAPAGPASSPKVEAPPPRGIVSDLPPPQPREPAKGVGGGGGGGGGAGRTRKRPKKDGAGEKPPAPYSQLQMQVVRVCGSEQGGGSAASQGAASGSGGATTRATVVCSSSSSSSSSKNATRAGSALPAPGTSSKGRGAAAHAKTTAAAAAAAARPRNAPHANGRGPGSSQETGKPTPAAHAVAASGPGGRGSRNFAGGGAHAPQCAAAGAAVGVATVSPPARHPVAKGAASAVPTSSPADDDDIMDYSSDDSPAKAKRSRVGRGRQVSAGTAKVLEPARGRTAATTAATAAAAAAAATAKAATAKAAAVVAPAAATATPSAVSTAAGDGKGAAASTAGGSQREATGGGKQMHLEVGDAGKLNLSKRRPLSRAGAGSAMGNGERASGDQATQASAGGAAAPLDESVGGGRKSKGGGKPQRTMTHLWKRAGTGQA